MKKLLYFVSISFFCSCQNIDDYEDNTTTHIVPETPPEGLKLKKRENIYMYEYYYHANGFVDSVYVKKGEKVNTHKFFYNNLNQIIEDQHIIRDLANVSSNTIKTTSYYYNDQNQILATKVRDENEQLIEHNVFNYNKDGSLYNPTATVENENLITFNGRDNYNICTFDSNRNPMYNIFPKAYRIINYINKNNIKTRIIRSFRADIRYNYSLSYNAENYPTSVLVTINNSLKETIKYYY